MKRRFTILYLQTAARDAHAVVAALAAEGAHVERCDGVAVALGRLERGGISVVLVGGAERPLADVCTQLAERAPRVPRVVWAPLTEFVSGSVNAAELVPREAGVAFLVARVGRWARSAQLEADTALWERLESRERSLNEGARERARLRVRSDALTDICDATLSFMAHDFRSPLAVILGHIEILQRGLIPAAQRPEAFAQVQSQVRRMEREAEGFLERCRTSLRGSAPQARADLADLVREVMATEGALLHRGGRALRLEGEAALVEGDLAEIKDTLVAVLDGAFRSAPRGSALSASIETRGDNVRLELRHEGPPYPVDALALEADDPTGMRYAARVVSTFGGSLALLSEAAGLVFTLPRAPDARDPRRVVFLSADEARMAWALEVLGPWWGIQTAPPEREHLMRILQGHPAKVLGSRPAAVVVDAADADASWLAGIAVAAAGIPWVALVCGGEASAERARAAGAHAVLIEPVTGGEVVDAVRRVAAPASSTGAPSTGASFPPRPRDAEWHTRTEIDSAIHRLLPAAHAANRPIPVVFVALTVVAELRLSHGWAHVDGVARWLGRALAQRALPGDVVARVSEAIFLWLPIGRGGDEVAGIVDALRGELMRARPHVGGARTSIAARVYAWNAASSPPTAGPDFAAELDERLCQLEGGRDVAQG